MCSIGSLLASFAVDRPMISSVVSGLKAKPTQAGSNPVKARIAVAPLRAASHGSARFRVVVEEIMAVAQAAKAGP